MTWPSGRTEEFKNVATGKAYECIEGKGLGSPGMVSFAGILVEVVLACALVLFVAGQPTETSLGALVVLVGLLVSPVCDSGASTR